MKTILSLLAFGFMAVSSTQAAVRDYAGVYSGNISVGPYTGKLVVGASPAGTITGGTYYAYNVNGIRLYVSIDQAKAVSSKVSSTGAFSGATLNGFPFSGKIVNKLDGTATFSGTVTVQLDPNSTPLVIPFSGTRIYK